MMKLMMIWHSRLFMIFQVSVCHDQKTTTTKRGYMKRKRKTIANDKKNNLNDKNYKKKSEF